MGYGSRAFLAGGLGFAVSFVVACGGGNGLLTGDQASTLNSQLASVSSAVSAGQCGAAASAATAFGNDIGNLPSTVNTTLVQDLARGAATVGDLAAKDCQNPHHSSSTSTTPTTTSSSTTTTPTTTSSTSSISSSTTSSSISTATNPTSASTSSTTSNGGVGVGGAGNNQNGQ
jgi:hypothetical protein